VHWHIFHDDDDDDDILFALKNWQGSWQFNLAHELKEN